MYEVYCDSLLLHHDNLEKLKIVNASVDLEVGKTGSFEFTIYPDHTHFWAIKRLKSIITVWQDDYLLFRGRALNEDIGFHNEKTITCEGDMAFLLDSIQRPYTFTGSATEFLAYIINQHNGQVDAEKRFTVGSVTVTGDVDIAEDNYSTTQETLLKRLTETLGGYIRTRQENDVNYIDYLSDFNFLAPQTIQFGKNLVDLKRKRRGDEICTAVIPLGKDGLTISAVNGGADYIEDVDAVSEYGVIVKSVEFSETTDASELLRKGQAYLSDAVNLTESIDIDAADLATVDTAFSSFHVGTKVQVISAPHGINQRFLVSKLYINLSDPAKNKLTLGGIVEPFSTAMQVVSNGQGVLLQEIKKSSQTAAQIVRDVEERLSSSIQQSERQIIATVSEDYYLKSDARELVASINTRFTQTAKSFEMEFNQLEGDIEDVAQGADAEFREIKRYIRFINGNIVLGESTSALTLIISNDRISFIDGNQEVAYFSNDKLFVTDAEFLNSIRLGNFAFVPRPSGNLTFMKVV